MEFSNAQRPHVRRSHIGSDRRCLKEDKDSTKWPIEAMGHCLIKDDAALAKDTMIIRSRDAKEDEASAYRALG